jgi:hypothetical protein
LTKMSKDIDLCSRCVEGRNFTYAGDNATRKTGSKTHHFVQFIEFAILNTLLQRELLYDEEERRSRHCR